MMRIYYVMILSFLLSFCFFSGCSSNDNISPSKSELKYFKEIALGSEYGSAGEKIMKWPNKTVTIKIRGQPDQESLTCLNSVIEDFNKLSKTTHLKRVDNQSGDIDIHFEPYSKFRDIEERYKDDNMGFFTWDNSTNCDIYKGRVLIDTFKTPSKSRCHLIREELTQSLGFGKDAKANSLYWDSTFFYHDGTSTTSYSEMDKSLIRMLYSTDIRPCSTSSDVDDYFNDTTKN